MATWTTKVDHVDYVAASDINSLQDNKADLKISAGASPGVNDDVDNYREGTVWVKEDTNVVWFCADNANGAAVWYGINQSLLTTSTPTFAGLNIKLDDLTAPDDNTDLNASTSKHGLCPKLGGGTTNFLRADGTWAAPAGAGTHATTHQAGGSDPIALDTLAAPTDITTLNASVSAHGLCPKLGGGTTNYLRADGTWAAPAGGSTPTGTGFRHVTSGTEDAATKLVENADVATGAAILESKLSLNFATHASTNDPTADQKAALAGTSGTPSASNKYVTDADARNTNARDPTGHNILGNPHSDTLSGAVTLGDIIHGNATPAWARLAGNTTATKKFLAQTGTGSVSAVPAWSTILAADLPVHASYHQSGGSDAIKLDDLSAPDDNTDLNASTSKHGLCPKLGGGTTNFLRADGTWAAPSGGATYDATYKCLLISV